MLKNLLEHPSFAKLPPALRTTIVAAIIAIVALILPYLPIRRETPPSLTGIEPVPLTQATQRLPDTTQSRGSRSVLEPTFKKAPTPKSAPEFSAEVLAESDSPTTTTLDDLDTLLEKED